MQAVSRSLVLLAVLLVACHRPQKPKRHAAGAIELSPSAVVAGSSHGAVDLGDEVLATEAEAIVSDRVLRRAVERAGLDHVPALAGDAGVDNAVHTLRAATTAQRRGKSLVLDVRVELADALLAKNACDAIVRAYLDGRLERRIMSAQDKIEWLTNQLDTFDGGETPTALREEIARQRTAASSRENDAWLQSPCEIAK
jgi:uncharacterized protein involved in exopolysaccharide biosynthesis